MKIFKKILSAIILALGTLMVIGLLLTFSIQTPASDVKMASYILGPIGAFLILLGIKLWDWTRIKMILGIVFTIIGIFFLFGGIVQLNSVLISAIIQVVYVVVFLPIGVLLIINQYKSDKKLKNKSSIKTEKQ
jgi:membrane-bound ClpP family serine protease